MRAAPSLIGTTQAQRPHPSHADDNNNNNNVFIKDTNKEVLVHFISSY